MMAQGATRASARPIVSWCSRSRSGRPRAMTLHLSASAVSTRARATRPLRPTTRIGPVWRMRGTAIRASTSLCRNVTADRRHRGRLARCSDLLGRGAPALLLFVALGIAIERALEVRQRDDESGPAIDETALEHVQPQERPQPVPQRAPHADAFRQRALGAQRGVEVGFVQHLLERAEREVPEHVLRPPGRCVACKLVVLVRERGRVAEMALAEELRRTVITVPAGAADPAPHEEVVAGGSKRTRDRGPPPRGGGRVLPPARAAD